MIIEYERRSEEKVSDNVKLGLKQSNLTKEAVQEQWLRHKSPSGASRME